MEAGIKTQANSSIGCYNVMRLPELLEELWELYKPKKQNSKVKINLNKKKKWITFVGKLNRSKGYDIFGSAVLKVLKKHKDWQAIVIGDEQRDKIYFEHERLKNLGFLEHKNCLLYTSPSPRDS